MAKVELRNLLKVYPERKGEGVTAVNRISLTVEDREFMVLVGPSGCGKSTALRMIAGLEEITDGEIAIDGHVINDIAPKDRDIAMVFQNYALYPHMSVYENMAFGLKLRKFSKEEIDKRVSEAAKILGIDSLLQRKPKALSGGQRQRVAVGRAIVRKPKVFLFDEPLSNLDAKMRVSTRTEISKLHDQLDSTMIYVTHDQVEAMTMGDRICVMKDGNIMQVAKPLDLYQRPDNLFVAGFIGSPPMNFLHGSVQSIEGAPAFVEDGPNDRRIHFELSARLASLCQNRQNEKVVFGIRPENIHILETSDQETTNHRVCATVDVAEPMGNETFVYLTTGAATIVARAHCDRSFSSGQVVSLRFDLDRAHLFDSETQAAIR